MTLLDRIPEGVLVAVDTAPWSYVFESHTLYSPLLRPLFDRFANGANRAGASILVLGELLVQPLGQGRADVANAYRMFFADAPIDAGSSAAPAASRRSGRGAT